MTTNALAQAMKIGHLVILRSMVGCLESKNLDSSFYMQFVRVMLIYERIKESYNIMGLALN